MDLTKYVFFSKIRNLGKSRYVSIPYQIAPPNDLVSGQMVKVTIEVI